MPPDWIKVAAGVRADEPMQTAIDESAVSVPARALPARKDVLFVNVYVKTVIKAVDARG